MWLLSQASVVLTMWLTAILSAAVLSLLPLAFVQLFVSGDDKAEFPDLPGYKGEQRSTYSTAAVWVQHSLKAQ